MTNILEIYTLLAPRINYPLQPTYRCKEKFIGYVNLLLSLISTPQQVVAINLTGEAGKRVNPQAEQGVKIDYLEHGQPCILNPDGTIKTSETIGYSIQRGIFKAVNSTNYKQFITEDTDEIADEAYLQPLLTSLYLLYTGLTASEAVMYLNDACTKDPTQVNMKQVNLDDIKRRI